MAIESLIYESDLRHQAIDFSKIQEKDFLPAIQEAIRIAKEKIDKIRSNGEEASFENTIEALEVSSGELDRVIGIFYNLYGAEATDSLQEMAPEVAKLSANFSSDILLDQNLFNRVSTVYNKRESLGLNPEQRTLLENSYKSFVRNGALLGKEQKEELRRLDQELSACGPKFSENLLKDTNAFEITIKDRAQLAGLPESLVAAARELALEKGIKAENAWVINLDAPILTPFLKFSEVRELREKVWRAYQGRCLSGPYDNRPMIQKIVELRHKRAKILGYSCHADYVLEERMAQSSQRVNQFLKDLLVPSKKAAVKDLEEVQSYAKSQDLSGELKPWDFNFYSQKLRKEKYDFDSEVLRPYFAVDKAIGGAFAVAEKLFQIEFREVKDLPVYHKDVQTYEVYDSNSQEFVGVFYADFFPRPSKRGGAWMTSFRSQGWNGKAIDRPHVSIVCNFTKPTKENPSLLSFDEVEVLFHEFGHSLHGLLSQCRYKSLGGTNVYWDFVELPSQFMENWLLEKSVLDMFAEHYQTGEKVPADLVEKLQKSSKFQSGYNSLRQINFSLLDMAWHGQYLEKVEDVLKFEDEATKETSLFPKEENTNFSCGFAHIFAGGYSAGYYSYKWAEVLDADAFYYFKEKGLFQREVSESFKKNILEKGGSEHPSELYRRFRGKDPEVKALLARDGLA